MPKLKQPARLEDAAMDTLLAYYTNFCNRSSDEGSLRNFQHCIAHMKTNVCPYIPRPSAPKFYERFLNATLEVLQYWPPRDFPGYTRAAYEIIMDRKIIGLKCTNGMLALLSPCEAPRIRGLAELEIPENSVNRVYAVQCFRLEDLTSLTFARRCNDVDLATVARNCPKLTHLDIRGSENVTDEGLRALRRCPDIRDLCVARCPGISYDGIKEFASGHDKIKKISAWLRTDDAGFDCFANPDPSIYRTINEFDVASDRVSNEHLVTVAEKFPNLTSLGIYGDLTGDLSLLKNLDKLSRLNFRYAKNFSWNNLRKLLTVVGSRVSHLDARNVSAGHMTQSDLNFLFKHCENVECLKFTYQPPSATGEKLVIPPFRKLKLLENFIPDEHAWLVANVEFSQMLELEEFKAHRFDLTADMLESIVLDGNKFPNLKFLHLCDVSCYFDIDRLRNIARVNNLDFVIEED